MREFDEYDDAMRSVLMQAARYRWLRDNPSLSEVVSLMARTEPSAWDATIDAKRTRGVGGNDET